MQRFIIEREIPGASQLTTDDLTEIATASNAVVDGLGVAYNWVTTYVAGDKLYCVHETDDVETVLEHGRRGDFPVDMANPIVAVFGPETATQ